MENKTIIPVLVVYQATNKRGDEINGNAKFNVTTFPMTGKQLLRIKEELRKDNNFRNVIILNIIPLSSEGWQVEEPSEIELEVKSVHPISDAEKKALLAHYKARKKEEFEKYKQAFEILQNCTSCNECFGQKIGCAFVDWGKKVVYNCPFFESISGKDEEKGGAER